MYLLSISYGTGGLIYFMNSAVAAENSSNAKQTISLARHTCEVLIGLQTLNVYHQIIRSDPGKPRFPTV